MKLEEQLVAQLEWLMRLARRYQPDKELAEDLAGEAVCRMLESKDSFRDGMPFKPWAKTIMENVFITYYNRRKKVLFRSLSDPLSDPYPTYADPPADALAEVSDLLSAISRLSKGYASVEAVRLYAVCGLSYKEVAERIGVPVDTARARIANGRRILRKELYGEQTLRR